MTLKTKASIICIILIQSSKSSMGYTTFLSELSTMHTNLSSKKFLIIHAEVPIKIPVTTQNKRTREFDPVTGPIPKKQKGGNPQGKSNPHTWNPLLKSKLTSPIELTGKPSFSEVLKYCGKRMDKFYLIIDRKCVPNALFGECYLGDK